MRNVQDEDDVHDKDVCLRKTEQQRGLHNPGECLSCAETLH